MLIPPAHRHRHMTTAAALLVAAPAAVPLSAPALAAGAAATDGHRTTPVRGWSVDLDRRATSPKGQRVRGRHDFQTVGVTWSSGGDPHVRVRTRSEGTWSTWQEADRIAGGSTAATEPVWVGRSQAVQVRVDTWRKGLAVVMVDPGQRPEQDAAAAQSRRRGSTTSTTSTGPTTSTGSMAVTTAAFTGTSRVTAARDRDEPAPRPRLKYRQDWGADERLRDGDPVYLRAIKQAHVHHTAGRNSYSRAEVPGIIRSMYWYHTQKLGWSDIGYNFLVDRFGQIWVGRAGGFRNRVRGAHTLGFNHSSFGVASIGNHEEAGPNKRRKTALVRLVAWKLDREGRNPAGRVTITSHGSDRYPSGTRVRLPVVDGHRDTNQTACPGIRLYRALPEIRKRAQARADSWG